MTHTYHDAAYHEQIRHVLKNGVRKPNRTGIDTIGVFGHQMRFDLRDGTIPLITTKKMHTRSIIHEILWYLKGDSNIQYLKDNNVTIWDEWADENGDLGPVYGVQWRGWRGFDEHAELPFGVDQIANVIDKLKNNPNDRRMIVSAWNVAALPDMKLPPCHYAFQFYARPLTDLDRIRLATKIYNPEDVMSSDNGAVAFCDEINIPKYQLSLLLNQRSCDVGLGVPFNIVQYSILLRMFCEVANMVPGEFIWSGADVHIYENHIDALQEQLLREPYPSPTFKFARKIDSIDNFKFEDFIIENYASHPTIKMDVAV